AALGYNGVHSGARFRTSEFETAVKEVGAAIEFMKERGFKSIFLVGHSLGTPIVEYYQGDKPDPSVKAVGVYGPHINIPAITRDSLLGPELYEKFLAECRDLVAKGKGDEMKLLQYREGRFIVTSAKTFLSYRDIDTSKAAVGNAVRQIKVPLLIVYDPADNIQGKGVLTRRKRLSLRSKRMLWRRPRSMCWSFPPYPAILRFRLTSSSKTRESSLRRRQIGCGVSASCRQHGCDERAEQRRSADGLRTPLTPPFAALRGRRAEHAETVDTPRNLVSQDQLA